MGIGLGVTVEERARVAVSLPLLSDEYEKKEKCGLFGIWGTSSAAAVCFQGIFAQQHRGQESAGIVTSDGATLHGHAGMGLVSQVFTPRMLKEDLPGRAGIGIASKPPAVPQAAAGRAEGRVGCVALLTGGDPQRGAPLP